MNDENYYRPKVTDEDVAAWNTFLRDHWEQIWKDAQRYAFLREWAPTVMIAQVFDTDPPEDMDLAGETLDAMVDSAQKNWEAWKATNPPGGPHSQ